MSNTEGEFNTAIGAGTLLGNTADQNTAVGAGALLSDTSGAENTANGTFALFANTSGFGNTAVGSNALSSNTTGGTLGTTQGLDVGPNTAVGTEALASNTTGSANTAVGYQALGSVTTGAAGTDLGANTAVGFQALANTTGGAVNSAFGYQALLNNTDGVQNTAAGLRALAGNTTGSGNMAIGQEALEGNTDGNDNTAVGVFALPFNVSGSENIALGRGAGTNITTASNAICIGTSGENVNNSCFIGNIFGATIGGGATPVFIDNDGQLGTISSSRRFKKEIKPMNNASETILALKPVTFHYKSDNTNTPQFGLIAEDVAEINPDLVIRHKNGEVYTVRYDVVDAMLLNEFLKEYRTVKTLKKEIEALTVSLKEQESKIQKISDQIQLRKPARRIVDNNR
jgi:Chaperone of endosialidase